MSTILSTAGRELDGICLLRLACVFLMSGHVEFGEEDHRGGVSFAPQHINMHAVHMTSGAVNPGCPAGMAGLVLCTLCAGREACEQPHVRTGGRLPRWGMEHLCKLLGTLP